MSGQATAPVLLPGFVPVPEERAIRYRQAGYWTGHTLAELILAELARQDPKRAVLLADDCELTSGGLIRAVEHMAGHLHAVGLRRGDRVVVQIPNSPEFVVLVLALWRLGVVPAMALPAYREHELRHIATASDAVALATSSRPAQLALARLVRTVDPLIRHLLVITAPGEPSDVLAACVAAGPVSGDVAVLLMSGGTTGLPKLIPRTHDDYCYNIRASAEICGVGPDTVYLAVLPAGHNFTLGCPGILGTLLRGGRVAFTSLLHPDSVLDAIQRYDVTMTAMVPTLAERVAEAAARRGVRPANLRLVQVGGARLYPGPARKVAALLAVQLQQVYGMAEGLLNFTRLDDPAEVIVRTQGRPASPDDEVLIVDPAGMPVGRGEVGELWCRGPYTIAGYLGDTGQNVLAFTKDGFYRTGDLVREHPSGNFVVEGRVKDVINKAGEKIAAAEVEGLVMAHPGVGQAAAVAMSSETSGEAVCLFIVPATSARPTLKELRQFLVSAGIARYKLPERLELLPELPLTPVGKVDKSALRAVLGGTTATGGGRAAGGGQ